MPIAVRPSFLRSNNRLLFALLAGWFALIPLPSFAQITIFNSNGFESPSYTAGPLVGGSPQQGWITTDLNNGSTPAAVIQSTNVFQGSQALQVIGPNLANDFLFSYQSFWYQDSSSLGILPYNPVLDGRPMVTVRWQQFLDGSFNTPGQIPFAGIYLEGLTASGTQQMITSVLFSNDGRVRAITTGGSSVQSAPLSNPFNRWVEFQADFNFSTQRFRVVADGLIILNNIAFRNTNGATNRLQEFGIQASAIDLISPPPTNNTYYDNFMVTADAVPEPSTLLLIGCTGLGYWAYRRRQNKLQHLQ